MGELALRPWENWPPPSPALATTAGEQPLHPEELPYLTIHAGELALTLA